MTHSTHCIHQLHSLLYAHFTFTFYEICIIIAGIDTLNDRREVLNERLFKRHVPPRSYTIQHNIKLLPYVTGMLFVGAVLHYLLPARCDNNTVNSRAVPNRRLYYSAEYE